MTDRVPNRLPYPLDGIPVSNVDSAGRRGGAWHNNAAPRSGPHQGTDWSKVRLATMGIGIGIPCVAAGKITRLQKSDVGGYGRHVEVHDDEGFFWGYAHMKAITAGLKVGDRVEIGKNLGDLGSSGTFVPDGFDHLHLALATASGAWLTGGTTYDPVPHIEARQTIPLPNDTEGQDMICQKKANGRWVIYANGNAIPVAEEHEAWVPALVNGTLKAADFTVARQTAWARDYLPLTAPKIPAVTVTMTTKNITDIAKAVAAASDTTILAAIAKLPQAVRDEIIAKD